MRKYAERMAEAKPSVIRELLKLSADPSIISFAGGNPDAELFPVEELTDIVSQVLLEGGKSALQYSITEGNLDLRRGILKKMAEIGIEGDEKNIAIVSGSQQALDLTAKIFVDKGDVVIVESPSYMGAINAFKYYEPKFVEVGMDEEGMRMDMLEAVLKSNPAAKFIYTIPDFQNPTGRTMALDRRKKLVELAEAYDVVVIEDSPYYDLRFKGEGLPPVKSFDKSGHVLYLGSMSKILCPALRVGWVMGDPELVSKYVVLKQACDLHTNELGQRMISSYMDKGFLPGHIEEINKGYLLKLEAMLKSLREEFPKVVKFTEPEGGLFVWLELPQGHDTDLLFKQALDEVKVAFVPGNTFYPYGGHSNTLRLSFATMSLENIQLGMTKLAKFFTEHLK